MMAANCYLGEVRERFLLSRTRGADHQEPLGGVVKIPSFLAIAALTAASAAGPKLSSSALITPRAGVFATAAAGMCRGRLTR